MTGLWRKLSRERPKMVFDNLPSNILHRIFEFVEQIDIPTLLSLSLTNKQLKSLSDAHIYRRIVIYLAPRRLALTNDLIRRLLADDAKRGCIQDVAIVSGPPPSAESAGGGGLSQSLDNASWATLKFLSGLLLRLKSLRRLEWLTRFIPPRNLSSWLEGRFPNCQLTIGHHDGYHLKSFPIPTALLFSLTATINYDDRDEVDAERFAAVQNAFFGAKRLRHLSVSFEDWGCLISFRRRFAFDLARAPGQLSSLRSLCLKGYRFRDKEHAELWKAKMDWSALHTLELSACGQADLFLLALTGRVSKLKSLVLEDNWYADKCTFSIVLASFLIDLQLEELSLPGSCRAVLAHVHGESLSRLTIHSRERLNAVPRETLSTHELDRIGDWCPSLTHLGLDVNRRAGWPEKFLATLAEFRLSGLTLFCELGISSPIKTLAEPIIDAEAIGHLYSRLTAYHRLALLEVHVGEQGRHTGGGLPAGWTTWEQENRRTWRATLEGGELVVRNMEDVAWDRRKRDYIMPGSEEEQKMEEIRRRKRNSKVDS